MSLTMKISTGSNRQVQLNIFLYTQVRIPSPYIHPYSSRKGTVSVELVLKIQFQFPAFSSVCFFVSVCPFIDNVMLFCSILNICFHLHLIVCVFVFKILLFPYFPAIVESRRWRTNAHVIESSRG
jgi:hypothetical protein